MLMPGRSFNADKYKFGFNGKEKDDDWHGSTGTVYDYGFRIYDARIAKFLSVDPLTKSYPWYTPYQFAGNKPIACIDLDGLEEEWVITGKTYWQPRIKGEHASGNLMKAYATAMVAMQTFVYNLPTEKDKNWAWKDWQHYSPAYSNSNESTPSGTKVIYGEGENDWFQVPYYNLQELFFSSSVQSELSGPEGHMIAPSPDRLNFTIEIWGGGFDDAFSTFSIDRAVVTFQGNQFFIWGGVTMTLADNNKGIVSGSVGVGGYKAFGYGYVTTSNPFEDMGKLFCGNTGTTTIGWDFFGTGEAFINGYGQNGNAKYNFLAGSRMLGLKGSLLPITGSKEKSNTKLTGSNYNKTKGDSTDVQYRIDNSELFQLKE